MTDDQVKQLLAAYTFPQWTPNETAVGKAWIQKHAGDWDSIEFNVAVGHFVDLGAGYNEATKLQAAINSQKRIDLLAIKGSYAALVEAKVRVSFTSLGQLLGYSVLLAKDRPELVHVDLVAIGVYAMLDIPEVLSAWDVTLELYPSLVLPEPTRVA